MRQFPVTYDNMRHQTLVNYERNGGAIKIPNLQSLPLLLFVLKKYMTTCDNKGQRMQQFIIVNLVWKVVTWISCK